MEVQARDVDLATWVEPGQGLEVWGSAPGDNAGWSVADAGDVNKDGYRDILVGAINVVVAGKSNAGVVYLVFGAPGRSTSAIDTASTLSPKAIQISGATAEDRWGRSVSGAGDVNKDGIDDFVIGGYGFDPPSRTNAGAAVVIFGKRTGWAHLNLANFTSGNAGFWIWGAVAADTLGYSVSGAGDVNGDGAHDVVVGANTASTQSRTNAGMSYVIFGHSNATAFSTVDLSVLVSGSTGFRIIGADGGDFSGDNLSGAGDVNGDGYSDIIIGALYYDGPNDRTDCGAAYVIFGHSAATAFTDIDLAALNSSQGFRITGAIGDNRLGWSVSSTGDFNHDGYADVVIGSNSNKAYVLFGHSNTTSFPNVDLAGFITGSAGFAVTGSGTFGFSVSGGADINGDAVDDVAITAPTYSSTGVAYVLYGRQQLMFTDINVVPGLSIVSGYRIAGAASGSSGSWSVSITRDFDGDGVGEVLVGAPYAEFSGRANAGAAYLIYGELSAPTSQPSLQPSRQPTGQPSRQPTAQPSRQPSGRPTSSPVSERSGDVDLATWIKPTQGLEVWGALPSDHIGSSVADAGDVNKDGYHDILIGAYTADTSGKTDTGAVYLVFGSPGRSTSTVDVTTALQPKGVNISSATTFDIWGNSVSGAGDFNKDGIDDFIIGGYKFDPPSRNNAGAAVVIFGKTSGWADIHLASFTSGSAGFWIYGAAAGDALGYSVSSAGDVNGDGADDVIVGAYLADPLSRTDCGAAYVIFGHSIAAFSTIDLATFATGGGGFRLFGAVNSDQAGYSVGGAGDINGDGFQDVLLGANLFDGPSGRTDSGAVYVIFGHSNATTFTDIDLAALTSTSSSQGFRITGAAMNEKLGQSVSQAGDFNHDGYDDIIVGTLANKAYILFGHHTASTFPNIDLATFTTGTAGFMVSGNGNLGYSVGGGTDINKDGVDDVVIAVPNTGPNGAVVLYGRSQLQWTDINVLSGLPSVSGYRILGVAGSPGGWSVDLVRDFDGDGVGDVVAGAPNADPPGRTNAGVGYLVYGESSSPTSQPSAQPSVQPTSQPTRQPTSQPSLQPTKLPTAQPTSAPTRQPTSQPSRQPSVQPSQQPTMQPSRQPTSQPSVQPSRQPTLQPSRQPTSQPSRQPSARPTSSPVSERAGDVDLGSWSAPKQGMELWGSAAGDNAGWSVAGAGDVNKDGYEDVLMGALNADIGSKVDAGAVYLVFGSPGRSTTVTDTASTISPKGIQISGATAADNWGRSVSGTGDINKDGIDDFIIGGPWFDPPSRLNGGAAVVIFGKTSGWADIDLASFTSGSAGFWIIGAAVEDNCGIAVSDAGDVNGDGAGDVVVGCGWAISLGRQDAGTSYVVFGRSTAFSAVDLSTISTGAAGFKISGPAASVNSGFSVGRAADVNGDGYGDILIGAFRFDGPSGRTDCGAAYVIFGHIATTAFTDIDLAALSSSQGFYVTGAAANNHVGISVSSAGDFNHDGYGDVVIGSEANAAYVIFGHPSTTAFSNIDLVAFTAGSLGFKVSGSGTFGFSVGGGVDVNRDAVDDIVISAPDYSSTGAAYVLYGRSQLLVTDINVLPGLPSVSGYRIIGAAPAGTGSWSVCLVRDFDGDGVGEVLVGARKGDPSGRADAGAAYLVYGELSAPTSQPSVQPSRQPTSQPSRQPTSQPTSKPSTRPTSSPVSERSGDVDLATWSKPGQGFELWGGAAGDH
jgi:hypothetical protein